MRSFLLTLTFFCLAFSGKAQSKQQAKPFVISYYSGSMERLDSFDVSQMSHLIYCFGHLKGSSFHLEGTKDTLMIQKMVALKKKNPALKVLLSLGGWGGCETCSPVFSTEANRRNFARSVQEITRYLGTDGIDLDWEYPAIEGHPGHAYKPEDRDNFTQLVQALREALGKSKVISFAAGGFDQFIEQSVDWKKVMPMIDFVNMMTYDLVNGYATVTGHHTPLYSTPQSQQSAHRAIQNLIQRGVPASKIILGAAFYSRVWEQVPAENNGLYQPGKFKMAIAYRDFPTQMEGFRFFWDSTAHAPYAYHPDKQLFATFDDKRSIADKTRYVQEHKLGGIMYWELGSDTFRNGLVQTINETLR